MALIIKDCIYRFIRAPELCKYFIDTPEFQRLRNIKQLGLAHFVYPSAVHTRFEHSLGVMHLAGVVVDELRSNGTDITPKEKDLLQLAGLFHDIGHMAFSHLFDYILEENKHDSTHEKRSCATIDSVNSRLQLLTCDDVLQIDRMICGCVPVSDPNIKKEKYFLYEIISNSVSGIDVDRLDYLQRDSYHTGIPGFQPDYLISCMRVQHGRLTIHKKAQPDVKMLYDSRKRLFNLVYRHKTVLKIEQLIREGIASLGYIKNWDNCKDSWLQLDDIEVYYKLRKYNPVLIKKIETRTWNKIYIPDRFKHISLITQNSIEKQINDVNWFN